jgi:hypothetical protein
VLITTTSLQLGICLLFLQLQSNSSKLTTINITRKPIKHTITELHLIRCKFRIQIQFRSAPPCPSRDLPCCPQGNAADLPWLLPSDVTATLPLLCLSTSARNRTTAHHHHGCLINPAAAPLLTGPTPAIQFPQSFLSLSANTEQFLSFLINCSLLT